MITPQQWREFRHWLKHSNFTLDSFSKTMPSLKYATVAKWSSRKAHPKRIHDATLEALKQRHPTCPLVQQ